MPVWSALVGAYIIGSVDFAVVVARAQGVDIHQVGSGNPGTSNVLRTLGRGPAAMVLGGDVIKGVIAAALGFVAAGGSLPNEPVALAAGFLAVLGHCFPVFHRFRGGKGVATAAGVMLWVIPVAALVLGAVWATMARLTRVASISSLTVVVLTIPLAIWRGMGGWSLVWLAAILMLIVARHKGNIERMIRGSERKVVT